MRVALAFAIHLASNPANKEDWIVFGKKPSLGIFKLNTDGDFDGINVGYGGIIRDHCGKVVMAYSGYVDLSSSIMAELHGLNFGINWAIKLGIGNIWIKFDAKVLINYINNFSLFNATNFYLISEIHHNLSLLNFNISHIYREGNSCADELDKMGCGLLINQEFNDLTLPKKVRGSFGSSLFKVFYLNVDLWCAGA